VEKGQAVRADFKARSSVDGVAVAAGSDARPPATPQMLARAMTRKGNALQKKGDLEGAVAAYSKVRAGARASHARESQC